MCFIRCVCILSRLLIFKDGFLMLSIHLSDGSVFSWLFLSFLPPFSLSTQFFLSLYTLLFHDILSHASHLLSTSFSKFQISPPKRHPLNRSRQAPSQTCQTNPKPITLLIKLIKLHNSFLLHCPHILPLDPRP